MTATTLLSEQAAAQVPWDRLTRGIWVDDRGRVCAMAALVPGARSTDDCVAAGWPDWLPPVVVALYDADVGAADEQTAADGWFRRLVGVLTVPVDYERVWHRWLIAVLEPISDLSPAVGPVIELHRRSLAGDTISTDRWAAAREVARAAWTDARTDAAREATRAAWSDARTDAREAARTVRAAARAAAGEAVRAAADGADGADAWEAAWTDARTALVDAITAENQT